MTIETPERLRLRVTGTVQGVGFRPHVHRLAIELGLVGLVGNDTTSVFIEVEGPVEGLRRFARRLVDDAPPLAHVDGIVSDQVPTRGDTAFVIAASGHVDGAVTSAPPDTAACVDCLRDISDPADRRYRYPFTTCTNCGPRFTIITALPYDRPATTMSGFPLCARCDAEYRDPTDRRFHAQPVACPACGPRLRLEAPGRDVDAADDTDAILAATQRLLLGGAVVAIKGIGGFHLACRADDAGAVDRLRRRKHRPGKPFALVARDLDVVARLAHVGGVEGEVLTSPAAPIVLLRRRPDGPLAASVAPGNPLVGVMLPASPLHHLLLTPVPGSDVPALDTLVLTSGNLAEEPLCIEDDDARERLAGIADAFLLHDRPIAVPCDDSVVRVDADHEGRPAITVIRRSRGYVPSPLPLPFTATPALAVGGQLKNTACLTDGRRAWLSAHVGDMGSLPTLRAFERTVERFAAMHAVTPQRLVADAHPDYTTHRWALDRPHGPPVVTVHHHHAHVAAVMAEHGISDTTRVLGFAFDGTGYGTDGTIWGGEALLADYDGFERVAHLSTVLLPGGDAAIRHPHRVALSHLHRAGIDWSEDLPAVAATAPQERELLATQLERELRCVPTSSVGRLFDAVASLLGVRHTITFEAQAAIELEILASEYDDAPAALDLPVLDRGVGVPMLLDSSGLIRDVVAALRGGLGTGAIALGFHHALATAVRDVAVVVRDRGGPEVVALSGGVFSNPLLTSLAGSMLAGDGFTVLRHRQVPPNDGGLALGQIAVGSRHDLAQDDDRS